MYNKSVIKIMFLVTVLTTVPFASAQDVKNEKYKLDNGMTVILHEDHGLPVAGINLWYRVGSKDEPVRRSGFAHLFEHLMFMGTERVPGNKFDTIMEGGGGANNATTSEDRTNYFSSGPASLLSTLLWLDADRLEDLARTMDQEKLDKQREVVRNERRQSYENRPYGKAELELQGMMYPPGHPYHIPTIGTHEDLEAASVADVKDFFATFYVPNNMTLSVAGDFESAKIKPLIADLFGNLPRGGDPMRRTAGPARLDGVKRMTLIDTVQLPKLIMAYHSPAWFAEGDAEMDLAGAVLSDGKTSRLYKRLVYDDKIAVSVSAGQSSSQLGSTFRIDVMAKPDANLDAIEKAVDEEVARFIEKGPTAEELEQRKATIELGKLERLQSVESKADQLNMYDYFWGEPNSFKRDLDRYRFTTAEKVQKWGSQVLVPGARVILRILPEAPQRSASARATQPTLGIPKAFTPQAPETFKLSNGIPVMLWPKSELPLVAVTALFRSGQVLSHNATAGLVSLTANMLDEGAGDLDALKFGDAMQSLGADFSTGADHESLVLDLTVLKRNIEKAAGLMADAARRPTFDEKEWDRVKRLHLENLKQQDDQPTIVASRVAARRFFGDAHPYGLPVAGTPDTVKEFKLDDIKKKYAELLRPEFATLLIAGDVSQGEVKATLEKYFGDWKSASKADVKSAELSIPSRKELEVFVVNRPESVQTVVQFIMPGPKYADEKRVQYRLLNTLFGGMFTSRLNMNLREEHGYTYGARSSYAMEPSLGYLSAGSSVRADVTGESLKEFLKEIKRIRGGDVSEEEAGKARETLRTDVVQAFAGLGGILSEAADRVVGGLPFESLGKDMTAMQSATREELNKLSGPAIPLESGILVLVGDKNLILEQMKDVGLPTPVEVDIRGKRN